MSQKHLKRSAANGIDRRTVLRTAGVGLGALAVFSVPVGSVLGNNHSVTVDLLAGQDTNVGTVTVTPNANEATVMYDTQGSDWELVETHLHVGDELADLPTNRPGNPRVGHFEYSGQPDPAPDTIAEYTVPIDGMSGTIHVAAHAVVQQATVLAAAPYGGTAVVDTRQAWRYDGTDVRSERSDPSTVLTREFGEDESNFYSLGFGGVLADDGESVEEYFGTDFEDLRDRDAIKAMEADIDDDLADALSDTDANAGWVIIEFDPAIQQADGESDLWVVEDTWGLPYPLELAAVFARGDPADDWAFVCLAHNQEPAPDISGIIHTVTECNLPDDAAIEVLVQDVTDPAWFDDLYPGQSGTLDGYDLNAVEALTDHVELEEETAWGDGDRFVSRGNWATHFEVDIVES